VVAPVVASQNSIEFQGIAELLVALVFSKNLTRLIFCHRFAHRLHEARLYRDEKSGRFLARAQPPKSPAFFVPVQRVNHAQPRSKKTQKQYLAM